MVAVRWVSPGQAAGPMRSQQTEYGTLFQYNHRSHFGSRYHIVACYSQSVLPHGFDSRSRTFCVLLTQGINWLDAADIPACTSGNSGMQRRKFRHAPAEIPACSGGNSGMQVTSHLHLSRGSRRSARRWSKRRVRATNLGMQGGYLGMQESVRYVL